MTLDGKTFQIYKFRTMVDEAEKDTGPVWASPEDPRRTPIGIWLRRFNLDELPAAHQRGARRHEPGRARAPSGRPSCSSSRSASRSTCCATA